MIEKDETGAGSVVVLVRSTSPFLPNSVITQREHLCLDLAERSGDRADLITGTSESGDSPIDRISGNVTLLVTWSAYGLVTSTAELAVLTGLMDEGLRVREASSGALVPVAAVRLAATLTMRPGPAGDARQTHAARTRQGRRDVAREGRWLGGRRPLGWVFDADGDARLDLTAAGHIRSGTQRVAAGTGVGSVAAMWNNSGFTTLTGLEWTFGSARRVLLRARNAGLVEYQGEIVGRSAWPAIVTVSEWQQARRRMLERVQRRDTA